MSSLSVADLLRARQVCRQWNEEASKYFRNRVKLKIYQSKELNTIQSILEKSKEMFCFPLEFKRVHLEAELRPSSSGGGAFDLFFAQFAPKLKTFSVKQSSWDTMFPLNRFTELEELTVYGNLNKHVGVFPRQVEPYLRNLKRAYFYLEGRITTDTAVEAFVINIATLLHSSPNLEEIIAPQKMDHRDETPESFRDLTANYIFLNLLCSEEATIRLPCLRSIHIDAKLEDRDLHSLGVAASKFPNVDTLRIALSGLATRRELIFVLESYADRLKKLAISYSKTHGHRMTLESFFLQDNPLKKLEYLSLKNYPASVVFVGAIRSLKEFRIEVRNIADCFPTDRDDFFLQPILSSVSTRSDKTWKRRDADAAVVQIDDSEPPTPKKMRTLRVDPSKAHGLTSFHYIHHKEGTQINLYGDRCPFTVTRRIAMRFPQLTRLTLDNMTGDSLTCVIKYLPLLEELHALGGFYNDLAITGASSKEELKDPEFPSKRKLPYIGDLKCKNTHKQSCLDVVRRRFVFISDVHTLSLSTFSKNSALWDTTDLLSKHSIYYGLMDCPSLRRLTLGNDERKISCTGAKFETSVSFVSLFRMHVRF